MAKFILYFSIVLCLFSCKQNNGIPDVSGIPVNLTTQRFEKDFFSIDSAQVYQHIPALLNKYPNFTTDFFGRILSIDPRWPSDSINRYVGNFINSYKNIYDTAEKVYSDFTPYEKNIKTTLQFIKYYFPDYQLPKKIVTYIGPLDGYGDILGDSTLFIGLQHHLGNQSTYYKSAWLSETYPSYLTAQFTPDYIDINCAKNILNFDLYPAKDNEEPLISKMIEQGKRLYVLSKFLPGKKEYMLIGYTEKQLSDCYDHEKMIWNMFIQNSLLQNNDPDIIKNYIGDSPKTIELGEGAPGNIGSFTGWQIVKKYMAKNEQLTLAQLLSTNDETIIKETKYKP